MKRNLIVLLLIISTAVIFAGCFDEEETAEEKIPYVKVQKANPVGSDTESVYAGRVCGRYETNMSFQVGGQIIRRNVDVGSRVTVGDLLMTVDPKDILQQSNQSDAKVSSALAQLKLAERDTVNYTKMRPYLPPRWINIRQTTRRQRRSIKRHWQPQNKDTTHCHIQICKQAQTA